MSNLKEMLNVLNDCHVKAIYSVLTDNANVPDISLEVHEEPTEKSGQIEAILKMDGVTSIDGFRDKFNKCLEGGYKTEMFTTDAKEINQITREDFEKFQTFLDKVIEGDPKGDPKDESLLRILSLFNAHNVSAQNIENLRTSVGALIATISPKGQ